MGVDIGQIVERKLIDFQQLSGKVIAVDAYNTIYQFLSIIRNKDGTPLMDSKGRITSHLSGLFYRNLRMIEDGIKIVYVFDGEPPYFKEKTIEARAIVKKEAEEKLKVAIKAGVKDLRKYAQATARIGDETINEAKTLLSLIGIQTIQAPSEGEAEAAYLTKKGKAFAVCSQDYDSLLFGAENLVRNLTISGRRKLPGKDFYISVNPEIINLNETLEKNGIERKKLIWLGMMISTDYNEGIKGIGPKTGLKIVREANSLEECYSFAKAIEKYKENEEELKKIEDFFLNPPVVDVEIKKERINKEKLIEFLCEEYDFSIDRVESAIDKLEEKRKETGKQKSLEDWI